MENLPAVAGLPVEEARARLQELGLPAQVRRTGELGCRRAVRRREREGLEESGDRVVRVRRVHGGVELVVAAAFRRSSE